MQEGPGRMGGARWGEGGGGGGGGGLCPSPYPPFSWPIQTLKLTNSDNCQFRMSTFLLSFLILVGAHSYISFCRKVHIS